MQVLHAEISANHFFMEPSRGQLLLLRQAQRRYGPWLST